MKCTWFTFTKFLQNIYQAGLKGHKSVKKFKLNYFTLKERINELYILVKYI